MAAVVVNVQIPDPLLASWGLLPNVNVVPLTVACNTVAPPGVPSSHVPVSTGMLVLATSVLTVGVTGGTVSIVNALVARRLAGKPAALAVCTRTVYVPSLIVAVVVNVQFPDPSLANWGLLPNVKVVPATVTCRTVALSTDDWSNVPVRTGLLWLVVCVATVGEFGGAVSTSSAPVAVMFAVSPMSLAELTVTLYMPSGIGTEVCSVQFPKPSLSKRVSPSV